MANENKRKGKNKRKKILTDKNEVIIIKIQ